MSNAFIQGSFAAGELSPALYARVDIAKYHVGAALLQNWVVDFRGGAFNRNGTEFVTRCKTDSTTVVLIPFQFSNVQTYMLEFGNLYMRVVKDGASVLETEVHISSISQASEGVITTTVPHGYSAGDWVFINGINGMTELNEVTAIVDNPTADNFGLLDLNGDPINTTNFTAYVSGGTVSRVFTLTTPYAAADLPTLKFTQSADVMTLTHPSYAPRELTRTGHAAWTLTTITFATNISPPTNVVPTPSAAGAAVFAYVVTSVGTDGQESVASTRGDVNAAVNIGATAGHIDLAWTAAVGASFYNVYKASYLPTAGTIPVGVNFGWIGDATGVGFNDNNIIPDFTITPPLATNPFAGTNWPGAVGYFQQRITYGGSTSLPETLWMSQPGAFHNFDKSNPVKDDDAITATLASRQVNVIKYMVAMPGGLLVFTSGGVWQISGGSPNAAVTPSSIVATPQAYNGCADIEPIPINENILYVQVKGSVVRNMSYNFYANIYTSIDISILSNHLILGFTIDRWAYAEEPFKVIWAVRSDGQLLSLTYLKEQEVYGWAHSQTQGLFKSVGTIVEGTENAVYVVVQRNIQGNFVQMIERMHTRQMPYGIEDAWFVDAGLTNALTFPAAGLTASAASGAGVIFTADTAATFSVNDVGSVLRMGGGIATITAYTDGTHLVGTLTRDIQDVIAFDPAAYPPGMVPDDIPVPAASGDWSLTAPVTSVRGLDHLEGQTVSILADGSVQPQQVVTNGTITLDHAATKIIAGLPYVADLQSLYLDTGEPTIQGKRKLITAMTVRVAETRGLEMGATFDIMDEFKMRTDQPYGEPIEPQTGDQRILMEGGWQEEGQVCIRQKYPLPATVLGIIPEIVIGDDKG